MYAWKTVICAWKIIIKHGEKCYIYGKKLTRILHRLGGTVGTGWTRLGRVGAEGRSEVVVGCSEIHEISEYLRYLIWKKVDLNAWKKVRLHGKKSCMHGKKLGRLEKS